LSKKIIYNDNITTNSTIIPPFERIYYEDLWDPIRFAIPATHPELESTSAKLPGDADVISKGRTSTVYRKTIQGRDVVVKMLAIAKHNFPAGTCVRQIRDELKHEAEVYEYLQRFQRDDNSFMTQFLWYGKLVPGLADCLVVEYIRRILLRHD
jgi:hypothetical protein